MDKINRVRKLSWEKFGKKVVYHLPGMIRIGKEQGNYPAISISGARCDLLCEHCRGKLLSSMKHIDSSDDLISVCKELRDSGAEGVLLTGGADLDYNLPWEDYMSAIQQVKRETGLFISIHSGFLNYSIACELKSSGVNQALIDAIGSDNTWKEVYHQSNGVERMIETLDALQAAGLEIVPHIVIGIHFGKILGEYEAVDLLKNTISKNLSLLF